LFYVQTIIGPRVRVPNYVLKIRVKNWFHAGREFAKQMKPGIKHLCMYKMCGGSCDYYAHIVGNKAPIGA